MFSILVILWINSLYPADIYDYEFLHGQVPNSDQATLFINKLREYDLNNNLENNYSITKSEYHELYKIWTNISEDDKAMLLNGSAKRIWNTTMALTLFYDLNNSAHWQCHLSKMIKHNALGLSITLSRFGNPMPLSLAINMLADQLCEGEALFKNGKLEVPNSLKSIAIDRSGLDACDRIEAWERLINENQNCKNSNKVKIVNSFFNEKIKSKKDNQNSQNGDYWQSPIETLVRGCGDCEDFAMAKYVSLRLLGIPSEQLLIAIVRLPEYRNLHGVLFYYASGEEEPWVMDNLSFNHLNLKYSHILRLSFRMRFQNIKPLLGINEKVMVEFENGKILECEKNKSYKDYPKFGTALINSKRLLPDIIG